jgi:hypothetical protein
MRRYSGPKGSVPGFVDELGLLVEAGLTPVEDPRHPTSTCSRQAGPARRLRAGGTLVERVVEGRAGADAGLRTCS